MVTVCFIVDTPGWALTNFPKRLAPHMPRINTVVHYLHKSLKQALTPGDPKDWNLPPADIYYFTTWVWMTEVLNKNLLRPGAKYAIDIIDVYSWQNWPDGFARVAAHADVILTQSLPFLHQHPTATFHPFPASLEYLARPRVSPPAGKPFKIGMSANGVPHAGNDHKGVNLMRSVHGDFLLEVAGTDHLYTAEEMPGWYDTLDAFCTLSLSEAYSNALVDACSLGVPIIGTPVSPLDPFVGAANYYEVQRNPQSIIRAMDLVKEETVFRSGREAAKEWAADKVAKVLERVLLGL